jgi:hypothetical protein
LGRYIDLLKQVPPGKAEIPEILLKKLDVAAINFINNKSIDAPEEEKRDDYLYEGQTKAGYAAVRSDLDPWSSFGIREDEDLDDDCSIEDEIPWATVWGSKRQSGQYYLGICAYDLFPLTLCSGSKEEMVEESYRLNKIRLTEGEEAYKNEIRNLRAEYERNE